MWEISDDCKTMLADWSADSTSPEMKRTVDRWLKIKPLVLSSDEVLSVLRPLADKVPIYLLIERLKLHKPEVKKTVNPEYQKHIQQLKWDQENREYESMIRSIDPTQKFGGGNMNFGEELKAMNRQSVVVFNTLLTVGGAFAFGFFGVGYAYPALNLNVTVRMTIGLILATVVFFADLYFIVKGMDLNQESSESSSFGQSCMDFSRRR
uniref:Transmembrane protein 199 n=1 Tax=Syphacia muris TaxID=451379 RepID=A0A0N5AII8_9BILA